MSKNKKKQSGTKIMTKVIAILMLIIMVASVFVSIIAYL